MTHFVLRWILYGFVFLTGAAGLVYQVAWQKYLSRLLGSDSIATAVILAAFLGGLSLGYLVCGRLTQRIRRPVLAYAVLEGAIGAWCLLFPGVFRAVESLTASWSFSPPGLILFQGLLCAALLIGFPTVCMGGTIPFLTRGFSRNLGEATRIHARVYAVNTAGAFLGALLAGFYLIPVFGLPHTVTRTALLNLAAGLFFLSFSGIRVPPSGEAAAGDPAPAAGGAPAGEGAPGRYAPRILYAVAFLSGFYVMTLENVLIRVVNLSLGSSSYSFSIIVSVFVLAIAVGSFVVGSLERISERLLYANQLGIALLLLALFLTLDRWPYLAHLLRISFQSNPAGFWSYYAMAFLGLAALLLLPVGLMGATVPILFHELKRRLAQVGRHSGNLLSWNTLGNLTGSLVGGILFYLVMDNGGVFLSAGILAAVSAVLAGLRLSARAAGAAGLVAAAALVLAAVPTLFDTSHFVVGTFRLRSPLPFSYAGSEAFFERLNAAQRIEFYDDGPAATVAVTEDREPIPAFGKRSKALLVNGKSDSSTLGDVYTVRLLAHLPALLAPERKRVMVVGLGTGVTAGELTLYPDVERIDVAEISPAVVEALPLFGEFTHELHRDPRLRIHIGDAFRIIGRSRATWDIIISEPSNPWVTGVDALFSRDFYRLARNHLTEDGVLMQWFHTIITSPEMLGMILKTLTEEFPETRVFTAGSDLLLLASRRPIGCDDLLRAERTLASNGKVRGSLAEIRQDTLAALLVRERWTPGFLADHFRRYDVQTLDFPRLHYIAGRDFFQGADLPAGYFLDDRTPPYLDEYLFYKSCADWRVSPDTPEAFTALVDSTRRIHDGRATPMTDALMMRAYLSDSEKFPLPWEKEKEFGIDVLPFVVNYTEDPERWAWIGLRDAPLRARAETLLAHVERFRNWMVPYPLDGLFALLEKGIDEALTEADRNWCVLQLARLRINEKAPEDRVRRILGQLVRDPRGRVVLREPDLDLLRGLEPYGIE